MDLPLEIAIQKLNTSTRELGIADRIPAVSPTRLNVLKEQYDLPSDLVKWYSLAEPAMFEIPRPVENIHFVGSDEFDEALVGYAYTWRGSSEMIPDDSWNSSWLVIGGEGEYPIIMLKESAADRAVYFGEAINDNWQLSMLSANLSGFLLGISEYSHLFLGKYQRDIYQGELMSNNYELDKRFVDDFSAILDGNPATQGRSGLWLKRWLGL